MAGSQTGWFALLVRAVGGSADEAAIAALWVRLRAIAGRLAGARACRHAVDDVATDALMRLRKNADTLIEEVQACERRDVRIAAWCRTVHASSTPMTPPRAGGSSGRTRGRGRGWPKPPRAVRFCVAAASSRSNPPERR